MCIEKCISGEIIDIVVSKVLKKYAILAGYKIDMNARFVCHHNPLPLGLLPRVSGFINRIQTLHLVYIVINFFFVIERTRDLIYLKFVATDFFLKVTSPSAGENSGDLA